MPPASLSTFEVMIPGPISAKKIRRVRQNPRDGVWGAGVVAFFPGRFSGKVVYPPRPWMLFSQLRRYHFQEVSKSDDPSDMAFRIHHRDGFESILGKEIGDFLFLLVNPHADNAGLH